MTLKYYTVMGPEDKEDLVRESCEEKAKARGHEGPEITIWNRLQTKHYGKTIIMGYVHEI